MTVEGGGGGGLSGTLAGVSGGFGGGKNTAGGLSLTAGAGTFGLKATTAIAITAINKIKPVAAPAIIIGDNFGKVKFCVGLEPEGGGDAIIGGA